MIRQVLKGDGIAFIGAMGVLTHKVLAPGEKLIVDTNSVVAWEETVEYGVKKNSGGLCMCCCGGEGFFSTQLTGSGLCRISTPSSRCSSGDDVASTVWGARNLISTQVPARSTSRATATRSSSSTRSTGTWARTP